MRNNSIEAPEIPEPILISELVTKYDLNPELRDIFVEGGFDAYLVRSLFTGDEFRDFSILTPNDVEITKDLVLSHGQDVGNRGRLVALSYEIERQVQNCAGVSTLADLDMDAVFEKKHTCKLIVFTDFTSIEMFGYDRASVEKVFAAFGLLKDDPARFIQACDGILTEAFLARVANMTLTLNLAAPPISNSCKITGKQIEFDRSAFIRSYAKGNDATVTAMENEIATWRERLPPDPRLHIHGDDFIDILAYYLKKRKKKSNIDGDVVKPVVLVTMLSNDLRQHACFKFLESRIRHHPSNGEG